MLATSVRRALDEIAWESSAFALATGIDETTGRYEGLAIPPADSFGPVVASTLLVQPNLARAQRAAEDSDRATAAAEAAAAAGFAVEPAGPGVFTVGPAVSSATETASATATQPNRFFGVYQVDATAAARPAEAQQGGARPSDRR